jgi:hypothetical protein
MQPILLYVLCKVALDVTHLARVGGRIEWVAPLDL